MNRACVLLVVAACTRETAAPPAPVATTVRIDATPGAPVVVAPAPDARTALPDLPPFARTAHSDPAKAAQLAHKAIRDTLDGDNAVADGTAAVLADPGSAFARYAIACAANDEAFATKQLELLATANCDDCIDNLRNVLVDADCPWTAAHKAIATTTKPSAQRAAAEMIAKTLALPDREAAKPFFTGARVTSRFACSNCSDTSHDRRPAGAGAKVFADITAILKNNDVSGVAFVAGERMLCNHDCCKVDRMLLRHNHEFLDSICFAPGTTKVKSIEFTDG